MLPIKQKIYIHNLNEVTGTHRRTHAHTHTHARTRSLCCPVPLRWAQAWWERWFLWPRLHTPLVHNSPTWNFPLAKFTPVRISLIGDPIASRCKLFIQVYSFYIRNTARLHVNKLSSLTFPRQSNAYFGHFTITRTQLHTQYIKVYICTWVNPSTWTQASKAQSMKLCRRAPAHKAAPARPRGMRVKLSCAVTAARGFHAGTSRGTTQTTDAHEVNTVFIANTFSSSLQLQRFYLTSMHYSVLITQS